MAKFILYYLGLILVTGLLYYAFWDCIFGLFSMGRFENKKLVRTIFYILIISTTLITNLLFLTKYYNII
jgi:hypothetical protein